MLLYQGARHMFNGAWVSLQLPHAASFITQEVLKLMTGWAPAVVPGETPTKYCNMLPKQK